jgi:hypothetical protein
MAACAEGSLRQERPAVLLEVHPEKSPRSATIMTRQAVGPLVGTVQNNDVDRMAPLGWHWLCVTMARRERTRVDLEPN